MQALFMRQPAELVTNNYRIIQNENVGSKSKVSFVDGQMSRSKFCGRFGNVCIQRNESYFENIDYYYFFSMHKQHWFGL